MSSTASTNTAINCRDVRFAYEQKDVLQGIDLTLNRGCFCGLLGPNGSGKTTLIQILAQALKAQSGQLQIFERQLASYRKHELARLLAVVPQRFELAFPFTVQEVVLLGRIPHRGPLSFDSSADMAIASQAMEFTEVSHLAKRRWNELSGGELKRVLVAKALTQQPQILLLDEAASQLDIRHQIELYQLIDRIRQQSGMTVLAAIHDLNLAAAYCDRFALLHAGRVAHFGPQEMVLTSDNLRQVYGIDIHIGQNELTGQRWFTPVIERRQGSST